ncbi:MAG: PAS domain S-box protein [Kofleriaceae bacterium]
MATSSDLEPGDPYRLLSRDELEHRARASENRFEQAFHGNAAAMVIAHRSDLRIIDVNRRWLELFGATREDVIGKTSVELGLISEADANARIARHKQFVGGYDAELVLRKRTGESLTVLASAKPIEIEEGPCTLTTVIDITARKHAEEAFEVAFSAGPAGMMLVHVATDVVVSVNARMLEMTGYQRDELVGRGVDELAFVLNRSRGELLAELERTGRLNEVELELGCKDGSELWTLASTETVRIHDTPHRLTAFTDITARMRVESRLLTQHVVGRCLAEAGELETAFPQVLQALGRGEGWECGAVWLRDEHRALQVHSAWRLDRLEPGALAELLERVVANGEAETVALSRPLAGRETMTRALAFPLLRGTEALGVAVLFGTGEHVAIETAERGLFDSIGRMLGLFVGRARAERSLRELNIELERRVLERTHDLELSNRDLEAFSSSISHDLRAPLRTIHGFSEILLEDFSEELPAKARRYLTSIHESGDRLRHLIDDLLAFSRLGSKGVRRDEVDLDELVRSVLDELIAARELGNKLELHVMPLGTCYADPSLLRAVWMNLLDNAFKYARDSHPMVIEVGRAHTGGETVFYVRDNGVGFDMAEADRLFGVFQRLHPPSEFEGTGVGLANVRRIVERHHGRVAASSQLGHGSRFEFTLGPT